MITLILIFLIIFASVYLIVQLPIFGKVPGGELLKKIKNSPNYKNGEFRNKVEVPFIVSGKNNFSIIKKLFTNRNPKGNIPSVKTDLNNLDINKDVLIWLGHSSYFMQIDGRRFLVDPVLSGSASPFSFMIKAFKGADTYKVNDVPSIDYLIITHDHYDHLDYRAVLSLQSRIKRIISPLGVSSHLVHWGFDKEIISELDWGDNVMLWGEYSLHSIPAQHFSGRLFKRNQSLWTSYVLSSPNLNIFMGGDGGYGQHFKDAGNQFKSFDLVILENGQYNQNWKHIHMLPEEVPHAAKDLNATRLLPIHNSKFNLSVHSWKEPLEKISAACIANNISLASPIIGEIIELKNTEQKFKKWWDEIE